MTETPYCLSCKKTLPFDVSRREAWTCPHCHSREYDYGIKEHHRDMAPKRDIICPQCKGMLEDVDNSKNLYCKNCHIEWRV